MSTSFKMIFCISFLLVFMQTGFTQKVIEKPVYKSWVQVKKSNQILAGKLVALNDHSILFSLENDRNAPTANDHQFELKIPVIQSIKMRKKGKLSGWVTLGTLVGLTGGIYPFVGQKKDANTST